MPGKLKGSSRPIKRPARAGKATVEAKAASPRASSRGPGRPFAADVLEQAKSLVADYQIILTSEDGEWYGRGLELPHVFRSEEHTSELQSQFHLVCRLLLEKKKKKTKESLV